MMNLSLWLMRHCPMKEGGKPSAAAPPFGYNASFSDLISRDFRMSQTSVKKVVLAYSGGLDTSVILKWLQETYGCEVVTFTADIGQGEEVEPARAKARQMGVTEIYIDDLREEFVREFVFPMFRANTLYEGEYLLGTSIARPLIAKRQIEIANEVGGGGRCGVPRRHRQRQRSGAFRTGLLRFEARCACHRAVARVGFDVTGEAVGLR